MDAILTQTILLVEDDENDVAFVTRALKKAEIASGLQLAEDGQQAIDYLSGHGEYADRTRYPMPALVLLDLKLPRVMGMNVLKWIRQQPELHLMVIIVLSSSQQRTDVSQACALGANSYLVKPSDPFDLTEMMELVKRYWLRLHQPTASMGGSAVPPANADNG